MPQKSVWGDYAESKADAAAMREGEEKQTDAIGEGLAAVAYALLDVAHAIREHTEARG
jgi:prephenate dehydratase